MTADRSHNKLLQLSLMERARVSPPRNSIAVNGAAEPGRYVVGKFAAAVAAASIVAGCASPYRGAENSCCVYVSDGSEKVPSLIALDESLERELLGKISSRVRAESVCWYQMPEGGIGADVPGLQYVFEKKDGEWVLQDEFIVLRHERIQ